MFPRRFMVMFALLLGVLASCGDERGGNAFCSELETRMPQLTSKATTQAEIREKVAAYRAAGERAPLAVRDDWNTITELFDKAASVDPTDEVEVQELANLAYDTKKPAERARKWVRDNCALDVVTGMDLVGAE